MISKKRNYLFITLDSCRYDSFVSARAPNMKSIGPLYKTYSNGNYTFASHSAMFVGFTPGNPYIRKPFVNPKLAKIFRVSGSGYIHAKQEDHIVLQGENIVDGFNALGYRTLGVAAMDWFNPTHQTSHALIDNFDTFIFTGVDIKKQVRHILQNLRENDDPKFIFLNIGETHVPYYYAGAPWDKSYNPCEPFGTKNSKKECQYRQKACIEYVDEQLYELISIFINDNIILCADHGDCWGEDGLWEHGIHHEKTVTVPLLFHLIK